MISAVVWALLLFQTQASAPELPPDARALLQEGAEAENRRDLDTAVTDFRKATEAAPSGAFAFFKLGEAYMNQRNYSAAIPPLKRAVELSPDSLPAHQLLGYALLAEGYASEAIPHLQLVHEYGAIGIAQLQVGQASEAVANLQTALAKKPGDPDLLYYLSRAANELSAQAADKLLSEFRSSARGHQALGQSYFAIKDFPDAAAEYGEALALRPDLPGLRLDLGEIYAATSDWDKAEHLFRAEAKLQPGNPEAAYRLGHALLQQGKLQEAELELRRSNELRPDMPETLYCLGKAAAVSDPGVAENALTRVTELEKESPLAAEALYALAAIHRKQGKVDQANREMVEFRRLKTPDNHGETPNK
jgi:tetratricopeptide (TPR) repeat protein